MTALAAITSVQVADHRPRLVSDIGRREIGVTDRAPPILLDIFAAVCVSLDKQLRVGSFPVSGAAQREPGFAALADDVSLVRRRLTKEAGACAPFLKEGCCGRSPEFAMRAGCALSPRFSYPRV